MTGIYVHAIDEDGDCHYYETFGPDYGADYVIEQARKGALCDGLELDGLTFEAFRISESAFATAKGGGGEVLLHRDGFNG